jgi:hypothetical protein
MITDDDRIDQIRSRWNNATPGPWIHEGAFVVMRDGKFHVKVAVAGWNDAEFISKAPEDIAWLIGKIERLKSASSD